MAFQGLSPQQINEVKRLYFAKLGQDVDPNAVFTFARRSINGNPIFLIQGLKGAMGYEHIPVSLTGYNVNKHRRLVVTKKEIQTFSPSRLTELAAGRFTEITGIKLAPSDLKSAIQEENTLICSANENSMAFKGVLYLPIKSSMPRN